LERLSGRAVESEEEEEEEDFAEIGEQQRVRYAT
jgi:hypothetical protein